MELIILMCIHILLAWSFYLPISGQLLNCGQHGLMAIGAYTAALLTLKNFPFVISIVLGGLTAALFGLSLGFLGLRLKQFGVVIVTIAYAEVIKVAINNTDKFLPAAGGPQGLFVPVKTTPWFAVITVILIGMLLFRMDYSKIGRAIKAIASQEQAAESLGVNSTAIKLLLMVMSGFICGIGGGLLAHYTGYIESEMFGFPVLIEACAFAVVGGIGTMWGAITGVLALDIFLESTTFLVGWRVFMYGAVVVLVMLFKPSGILTERGLQFFTKILRGKIQKVYS